MKPSQNGRGKNTNEDRRWCGHWAWGHVFCAGGLQPGAANMDISMGALKELRIDRHGVLTDRSCADMRGTADLEISRKTLNELLQIFKGKLNLKK